MMETINKDDAHKLGLCCIAWSPCEEMVFATGSLDKTIKVWDAGQCSLSPHSPAPISEPLLLRTLYTNAEVSKVYWAVDSAQPRRSFLTHLSQNSTHNGVVQIFDAHHPNVPACIIPAHGKEHCHALVYISCADSSTAELVRQQASNNKTKGKRNQKGRG
ncbi:hypothetical protein EON65_49900, partial [archaeon]